MQFNKDVFRFQFVIVQDCVRHLAYARAIQIAMSGRPQSTAFWAQTFNAHVEAAILDWCKVFGSDGSNETHWHHTSAVDVADSQAAFRSRLLEKTGLDQTGWHDYWEKMKDFRDKYVAHVELDTYPSLPELGIAKSVAFAYDEWVRFIIAPDFIQEPSIEMMYSKWVLDAQGVIAKGLSPAQAEAKDDAP